MRAPSCLVALLALASSALAHAPHDTLSSHEPLSEREVAVQLAAVKGPHNAIVDRNASAPLVNTTYAAFQGTTSSDGVVDSFLGMPYAQAPIGDLRFRQPLPINASTLNVSSTSGSLFNASARLNATAVPLVNATTFGNACPQQAGLAALTTYPALPELNVSLVTGGGPASSVGQGEDCLYINVIRPANLSSDAGVPVVVWFYGGGFQKGDASAFDGVPIVRRSVELGRPVIYVSLNYRLNAFGFLGGKQVKEAGVANLGLHDQRLALHWVQEHICNFGGDPYKVIIWGQSAGSISVTAQLAAYDGNHQNLFRGAILESGYTKPTFDTLNGQAIFDQVAAAVNCSVASAEGVKATVGSNNATNTTALDCLRSAPYEDIHAAVLGTPSFFSYRSLNLTWPPSVDGVMLKRSLRESFTKGLFAKVPILAGDCDDEGTLFSMFSLNVTTNQNFLDYIQGNYLVGANDSQIAAVGRAYPDDPTKGSPFGTGTNNSVTPQFKRIAAFQTDYMYQSGRRLVLHAMSKTHNVWSYLYKRDKDIPILGASHETDLKQFYQYSDDPEYVGTDALINFAHYLNPNTPAHHTPSGASAHTNASKIFTNITRSAFTNITWPKWNETGHPLLTFQVEGLNITKDDFRIWPMKLLTELQAALGQ